MKRFGISCTGESRRSFPLFFLAAGFLLLCVILSLSFGAEKIAPDEIFRSLTAGGDPAVRRILLHVRIPRLIAALLAGTGLSVSGVLLQTVLANPLASPGIIGVNGGAGLAETFYMVFFPSAVSFFSLAAFLGALAAALLVYGIARNMGASRITLILSGVAISSLMSAGINTLVALHPDAISGLQDFQSGGFSGASAAMLIPAGTVILAGLAAALIFSGELDMLELGEEMSASLGLRVRIYRFFFLTLAAALAGAAVSFAGLLGFVGLIVPHIVRLLLPGGKKRNIIALSALTGPAFLSLCDTAARVVFAPFELPTGILISYLGVPFFLWLLFQDRRKRRD